MIPAPSQSLHEKLGYATVNLSAPFINRPIATSLLMVTIVLLGIIGYELLPVAALPEVDSPTIQVTAQLPGADSQTVASSVATPLERQFGQIPGLAQMTSNRIDAQVDDPCGRVIERNERGLLMALRSLFSTSTLASAVRSTADLSWTMPDDRL